jgi:hypothetical protein
MTAIQPGSAPCTLVYQMARVGSISWFSVARELCGTDAVLHLHYMAQPSVSFLRALLAAEGPEQTIVRRQCIRSFIALAARGLAATNTCTELTIITAMRDPVARALSVFFFLADFFGCSSRALSWRDGAKPIEVAGAFKEMLERSLNDEEPGDTFSRMCWFMMRGSRTWFDDELWRVYDFDIRSAGFAPGPVPRFATFGPLRRLLVYRTEDMKPGTAANKVLLRSAGSLLGTEIETLPLTNDAAARRSGPLFEAVRQQIRLPICLLDRIYRDEMVRLFYTDEEIEAFQKRWSNAT